MKIILVGPVYPYKSGISHYTSLMFRALQKKHQTLMFSFKFQYPRFLFRKEQKDFNDKSFAINDTKYLIHTLNPFNWFAVAREIRKESPDAVIFQWWHPYFVPCYYVLMKLLRKQKLVFICHNVFPHERFPLDRFLTKCILKGHHRFIVHSHLDEQDLLSLNPTANYRVNPHPTYNIFRQKDISTNAAREELCLVPDTPVLLFFGFIREYKGLKHLLKAMSLVIKELPAVSLLVVGEFADDKQNYLDLINDLDIMDKVRIVDGYIPNDEVENYFAATDLVVLPYESATQSGIAQIAFGFDKPVIVTNVGGLPDIVINGKTGYVVEPQNPELLAEAIIRYFNEANHDEFRDNIKDASALFSWERMADKVVELVVSNINA